MSSILYQKKDQQFMGIIRNFIAHSEGLREKEWQPATLACLVQQEIDQKLLWINGAHIIDVIERFDPMAKEFLQVNFVSGQKILLTQTLIGFRPKKGKEAYQKHLPKVTTTPDLISLYEAILETLSLMEEAPRDLERLTHLYECVLAGGEAVGFDLSSEKTWLGRLYPYSSKLSA